VASPKYKEYTPDFDALIQSIQVFKKTEPAPVAPPPTGGLVTGPNITLLPDTPNANNVFSPQTIPTETARPKKTKGSNSGDGLMLLLILAGAVGAIIFIKKKKQG